MADISIEQIKKLKELSGAGLTDAKKALVEAKGEDVRSWSLYLADERKLRQYPNQPSKINGLANGLFARVIPFFIFVIDLLHTYSFLSFVKGLSPFRFYCTCFPQKSQFFEQKKQRT